MKTWGDFKEDFKKDADSIITSFDLDHIERIYHRITIPFEWDSGHRPPINTHWPLYAFYGALSSCCGLLAGSRGVLADRTITHSTNILSPFERGLLLDYLFCALEFAENASNQFKIKKIDELDSLFQPLQQACKNGYLLHHRMELVDPPHKGRDTLSYINIYKVDSPYLDFYYREKRNFPWQRRNDTKDSRKYTFPILGQHFICPSDCAEPKCLMLLDWYLREKCWGVNLSALLSQFSPALCEDRTLRHKYEKIWLELTGKTPNQPHSKNNESTASSEGTDKSLIQSLMEIPFPAYRITFMQSALKWYINADDTFFMKKLFPEPFRNLVTDVCKLPPQRFSSGSGENPVDINSHNLARLMSKAFVMSVLLGMTAYFQGDALPKIWYDFLEQRDFWKFYTRTILAYICDEIHSYCPSDNTPLESRLPLVLPPYNTHSQVLLSTLNAGNRVTDIHTRAYCEIQSACYTAGLDNRLLLIL